MNSIQAKNPFILTIFGASGDLAKIKIFPALYQLEQQKRLPDVFYIVGFSRTKKTDKEFRAEFEKSVRDKIKKIDEKALKNILKKITYFTGQYNDIEDFRKYRKYLKKLTKNKKMAHIGYFSVPPQVFMDLIENLGKTFHPAEEDIRLVIEKPFGEDRHSARELFHQTAQYFHDKQLYLLDHYLGKTAVQSLLHLRHANRILNIMIKGPQIANIQITAFEDFGVPDRIGYFEQVGTLKDMVQSHLLQVLALMTMSIPITEKAESLHREKYAILSALSFPASLRNIVLGQYKSYRSLKGVPKKSQNNTFAAMRLFIDRESWYKVPIYFRTGKMLHEKHTFIVIEFKKFAFQKSYEPPNRLLIELAPEEKVILKFVNKIGGTTNYQDITTIDSIACEGEDCLPEHGHLLLDVIHAERLHFLSFPEIIASWRLVDTIMDFIKEKKINPEIYDDNSPGPPSQNKLTKMDGFEWFDIH